MQDRLAPLGVTACVCRSGLLRAVQALCVPLLGTWVLCAVLWLLQPLLPRLPRLQNVETTSLTNSTVTGLH